MGRPRKYPKKESYNYVPKASKKEAKKIIRYSIFSSGGYWVLQDMKPEEPGYVFEFNGRKMYAARVIAVASSKKELRVLKQSMEAKNV